MNTTVLSYQVFVCESCSNGRHRNDGPCQAIDIPDHPSLPILRCECVLCGVKPTHSHHQDCPTATK